jgi:hypothetical protein
VSKQEPAMLFFGDDFYGDEHVLRMSFEAQGVYHRLLWIARRNGGSLPSDLDAIAELLQLPRGPLTRRRFLAQVWPRIAPCWTADGDGRLVQKRLAEEMDRRAAARADAGPAEVSAQFDGRQKDPQRQAAARARWAAHHAAPHAPHDARTDAAASPHDAAADAGRNAAASPSPAPLPVQVQENQPQTRASGACESDAPASCETGASAERAEPQSAEPQSAEPESGRDEVIQIQRVLLKTTYRDQMPTFARRAAMLHVGQQLVADGGTAELVERAWQVAQDRGEEPGGLLAHWIEGGAGALRCVLDEQAMKAKEAALAERRNGVDVDLMEGVYQ